jgi:hypothetical protein
MDLEDHPGPITFESFDKVDFPQRLAPVHPAFVNPSGEVEQILLSAWRV